MSPLVYEYEGKGIFRKHGFPMLDSVLIESADEAKAAYDKIGRI
jgi:succinyl-CoA synthetase beta subunit